MVLLAIWGLKNGPWVQGLHACFFVGGILAPLLVKPFLSTQPTDGDRECYGVKSKEEYSNYTLQFSPSSSNTTDINSDLETDIWKPYLIAGIVLMVPAIVFLIIDCKLSLKSKRNTDIASKGHYKEQTGNSQTGQLILVGLMAVFIYLIMSMGRGVSSFLLAYAVHCLGWYKGDAALLKTAYQASGFTGRTLGILAVRFLSTAKLLIVLCIACLVAVSVIVAYGDHVPVMWISIVLTGLSAAPMHGYCLTWGSQYIFVTGKVSALFTMMGAVSDLVGPLTINLLYDNFGLATFIYYCVALSMAWLWLCVAPWWRWIPIF